MSRSIRTFSACAISAKGFRVLTLKMALRNVFRQKRRSIFTALSIIGGFTLAVIFIGIALGELTTLNWNIIWPLILIVLGLSFLFRGFFRSK